MLEGSIDAGALLIEGQQLSFREWSRASVSLELQRHHAQGSCTSSELVCFRDCDATHPCPTDQRSDSEAHRPITTRIDCLFSSKQIERNFFGAGQRM